MFNFFGGNNNSQKPAQQSAGTDPQQQQAPAGQPAPQGQPASEGQPAPQGQSAPNNDPNNPVDIFGDLFNNTGGEEEAQAPTFNISEDSVRKAAQSIDFSQGVSQEDMQALQQGDMQALGRILNSVGQNAYSAALQHSTVLTDKYVEARTSFERQSIPSTVKQQLTASELDNDKMAPSARREMSRVAGELQRRYPEASPQWIAKQSKEYMFHNMAGMLGMDVASLKQAMQSQQAPVQQDPADIDWSKDGAF